ncbi:MAG: hypothetical protein ACXV8U_21655 [Methylobacter sp.]
MKRLSSLFIFALILPFSVTFAGSPLIETPTTEKPSFVPVVMTRWVKVFLELEMELDHALRQGNQTRINELVKDDFEQRIGAQPGSPIPKEDWQEQYLKHAKDIPPLTIEQMAARDLGDIIVVSFKWAENSKAGLFIVDIWEREGEGWKLAARYADPESPFNTSVPGTPTEQRVFPKKY